MLRLGLIFQFILINWLLFSQSNWKFTPTIEREAYFMYDGIIDDKFPITIYFEPTWNYCGEGNAKWDPRILKGWYEYKKYGKKIPLIGSIIYDNPEYFVRLFVPENLLDTLILTQCEPESYKEVFIVDECCSVDSMQWKTMANKTFKPVSVVETHALSWKTKAILSFEINELSLYEIDLTELTGNQFIDTITVESMKEIDNNFYAIISYGHWTNPGYVTSGSCGAGWENWLALIKVNHLLEIEKFEFYQNESCVKVIEKEYSFDRLNPEKGFATKSY